MRKEKRTAAEGAGTILVGIIVLSGVLLVIGSILLLTLKGVCWVAGW